MNDSDYLHIEKQLSQIESKLETLQSHISEMNVFANELKHIKRQLDGGAPTIKQCDSRGRLLELKVANLEKLVYGLMGVILTTVAGGVITQLIGV